MRFGCDAPSSRILICPPSKLSIRVSNTLILEHTGVSAEWAFNVRSKWHPNRTKTVSECVPKGVIPKVMIDCPVCYPQGSLVLFTRSLMPSWRS